MPEVWAVNQQGENIAHAKTPDIGTILEVLVYHVKEGVVNANIRPRTGGLGATYGVITLFYRRITQQPHMPGLLVQRKIPGEWQTGWKGGEYRNRSSHVKNTGGQQRR